MNACAITGALAVALPQHMSAQPDTVVVGKAVGYEQTSSGSPILSSYSGFASATFLSPIAGDTGTVQKPNGTVTLAVDPDDAFTLYHEAEFATLTALNSGFPNGNYRFRFGSTGTQNFTVAVTSFALPAAPRVTNFDQAQQIDPNTSFTLQWENPPGATGEDLVVVLVDADDGSFHHETSGSADITTQGVLPPMPLGRSFTASIAFIHAVSGVDLGNGVLGGVAAVSATQIAMRTVTPGPTVAPERRFIFVPAGGEVVLVASANGPGNLTFKWQHRLAADKGTNQWSDLSDGPHFSNSGSAFLRLLDALRSSSGDEYRCVATNVGGSTPSDSITVAVAPPYLATTVAGVNSEAGGTDGTGTAARFIEPRALALDGAGNLYIADKNAVRKMTPAGEVSTLAGLAGVSGITDGTGADARFTELAGIAVNAAGFVYVADRGAHTIRRISPGGVTTTWAGLALTSGSTDGVGASVRFLQPGPLVFDASGNLFVADVGNFTIRRIAPDRTTTTHAGSPGQGYFQNGNGAAARFGTIGGLAINAAGNLIVADTGSREIREVTPQRDVTSVPVTGGTNGWYTGPAAIAIDAAGSFVVADGEGYLRLISADGVVNTIAGRALNLGHKDGLGGVMEGVFSGVAADWAGRIYFCDRYHQTVRTATPVQFTNLGITLAASPVAVDHPATLSVGGTIESGVDVSFQWRLNGVDIAGATAAEYHLPSAQEFDAGGYSVRVMGDGVSLVTAPVAFAVNSLAQSPAARLTNLSTRALDLTDDKVLIPGFVIAGPGNKKLLIRAVGPTLGALGVGGTLPNPRMVLKRWNGAGYDDVMSNDDWGTNANVSELIAKSAELFAFPLDAGSADAALLVDLPPGRYSVVADDPALQTGVAIVELYDADDAGSTSRLINISNRGYVGTGDSIMIPGFVVSSEGPKTLLIRAVGPTLDSFGVSGVLADPTLSIFRHDFEHNTDELILTNDDWSVGMGAQRTRDVAAQVQAFALPEGSKDAAFVVTLNPGIYTVHARGKYDAEGVALVEVYAVP